jgi:hypothetical protein
MVQFMHYVVVFVSGAVLMSLEIAGSRILAPNFGSSIFVWGSLISVVMTALSIGYYWGGWLSAREPSYGKLAILLVIPGIVIFFLPFLYPAINDWIASIDLGNRLSPLFACGVLFLVPGVFLGTVSPYVIRLAATKLSTVGSTAGTLYAVSTAGSIFGTLITAFYLIPVLGVSNIIHCSTFAAISTCRRLARCHGELAIPGVVWLRQRGIGAGCMGENLVAKRHLLSSHTRRGGRRSALHVLRSHAAERHEPERSDGASAGLFALHVHCHDVSSRCQTHAADRSWRRFNS